MGMLDRFKDIMSSNVNAMLDKMENPEKMIDQYLINAKKDLAMVRKETAGVMAAEKNAKDKVDRLNKEITDLTEFAKKALQAGNRDDASKLVAKKQKLEAQVPDYTSVHEAAQLNANQMKEMHNKLVEDISTMEQRKDILKGKVAAAKARETVNKMGANSSKHTVTTGKMSDMENKINQRFNAAMAESELLNDQTDETEDLMNKYKSGTNASVDSELDELEIALGIKSPSVENELSQLEAELEG